MENFHPHEAQLVSWPSMIATRNYSHSAEHGGNPGCWTKAFVNTLHGKPITSSRKVCFLIFINTSTKRSWVEFSVLIEQNSRVLVFDDHISLVVRIWQVFNKEGKGCRLLISKDFHGLYVTSHKSGLLYTWVNFLPYFLRNTPLP